MSRDTSPAKAAMLAASWLEKVTSAALVAWVEEYPVIRIAFHLPVVVLWCDERLGHHTLVEQDIWHYNNTRDPEVVGTRHPRPSWWQENTLAYRE